jgi:hypothetical protein
MIEIFENRLAQSATLRWTELPSLELVLDEVLRSLAARTSQAGAESSSG